MRKMMMTLTLALTTAAFAQSQQAAQSLLDQGRWQEAAAAGAALNTSAGYALAAQANTMGASVTALDARKPLFNKAQDYAKKAISLDPNNADAYFELARAQGRLAQYAGVFQSLGMAKDMKVNLDKAVSLDPNLAGAYVGLGLWNASLDTGGLKGSIAAQQTGANKANVASNFEKAFKLEPNVNRHHLEYANALLVQGNKTEARSQLQKAIALPAETYWAKHDQAVAQAMLAKLK
ncbi:tetratricopeptide repeat protein [Deinococcus sp.]|uniref:tetratricopeptide repeat protein n=1 Tax=Deinococcus sp. TaxID=47478 RepID=UPI0025BA8069|nr:tetratricopeptide repeat protein [Deinococcus sp.]